MDSRRLWKQVRDQPECTAPRVASETHAARWAGKPGDQLWSLQVLQVFSAEQTVKNWKINSQSPLFLHASQFSQLSELRLWAQWLLFLYKWSRKQKWCSKPCVCVLYFSPEHNHSWVNQISDTYTGRPISLAFSAMKFPFFGCNWGNIRQKIWFWAPDRHHKVKRHINNHYVAGEMCLIDVFQIVSAHLTHVSHHERRISSYLFFAFCGERKRRRNHLFCCSLKVQKNTDMRHM